MKYLTIALIFLASVATSCKKESKQKCYWSASCSGRFVHAWHNRKPSNDEVKKVEESFSCSVTLEERCFPCGETVTDPGGFDVPCD